MLLYINMKLGLSLKLGSRKLGSASYHFQKHTNVKKNWDQISNLVQTRATKDRMFLTSFDVFFHLLKKKSQLLR
jgi:hypothetical protein